MLTYHHKWNLEYLDNLIVFEKDLYIDMLANQISSEKQDRHKKQEQEQIFR